MMDLSFIRQGYKDKGLNKEDLNADPIIQFESWFEDAKKSEPIPTAMSLSTVNNKSSYAGAERILLNKVSMSPGSPPE